VGKHLPFHCQDVRVCAAALLDGQLSPAEEQLMEEHLFQCEECSDFLTQLEEQYLQPPHLQIIQDDEYWSEMDSVLQSELDQADQRAVQHLPLKWMLIYAALLLLSILWGSYEHQKAEQLEYVVQTQQQTLERLTQQAQQNPNKAVLYVPAKMEL
jgi:hypothetical protein